MGDEGGFGGDTGFGGDSGGYSGGYDGGNNDEGFRGAINSTDVGWRGDNDEERFRGTLNNPPEEEKKEREDSRPSREESRDDNDCGAAALHGGIALSALDHDFSEKDNTELITAIKDLSEDLEARKENGDALSPMLPSKMEPFQIDEGAEGNSSLSQECCYYTLICCDSCVIL